MNSIRVARRLIVAPLSLQADSEILNRFALENDPEAFSLLVRRHGPLVLATCRRVLGPSADADDVFQTVFLILARRAGSIRDAAALPAWLHKVSLRIARKILARRPSSASLLKKAEMVDPADPFAEASWKDVRRVLDEELNRLPEKYRVAVVLCLLVGNTQAEAAKNLGVSLNTLKRRLESGRKLLRSRLTRRGVAPVVLATAILEQTGLSATVPAELQATAERLADRTHGVSAKIVGLAAASSTSCAGLKLLCLAAVATFGSVVAMMSWTGDSGPTVPMSATKNVAEEPFTGRQPLGVDSDELLPKGAVTRFGGLDFRTTDGIDSTMLSPDGKLLALAGGSVARVYKAATWELVYRFSLDDSANHIFPSGDTMAFSADGRYLGYARNDEAAYVWDLRTGQRANLFTGESGRWMRFCAFTSDGLFALSEKRRLYFYDPASGREVRSVPIASGVVALSSDGGRFLRRKTDEQFARMLLGDAKTGKDLHEFDACTIAASFSPDGKGLCMVPATGKEIQIWDVATRTKVASFAAPEFGNEQNRGEAAAGFSSDGKTLWLTLRSGDVIRWDRASGKELARLKNSGAGPSLHPLAVYTLSGNNRILTPSASGWVRVWDATTGKETLFPNRVGPGMDIVLSRDGQFVAVVDESGQIDLRDAVTGKLVRVLREKGKPIGKMLFSPDGAWLAVGETVRLPDGGNRGQTVLLRISDGKEVNVIVARRKSDRYMAPVGFLEGGNRLVVKTAMDEFSVWNLETSRVSGLIAPSSYSAEISPDGKTIAMSEDGITLLVDVASDKVMHRIDPRTEELPHIDGIIRYAWSADGKTLAVGLPGNSVAILDPVTGKERTRFVAQMRPYPNSVRSELEKYSPRGLGLSPDGKWVAVAINGRDSAVWDTSTGKIVAELPHEFQNERPMFTPDGKSIITFGWCGVGYRWDLATLIGQRTK